MEESKWTIRIHHLHCAVRRRSFLITRIWIITSPGFSVGRSMTAAIARNVFQLQSGLQMQMPIAGTGNGVFWLNEYNDRRKALCKPVTGTMPARHFYAPV